MADEARDEGNGHPAVMFEIIARDQEAMKRFYGDVFGWNFEDGSEGFAYVHFGVRKTPLLGGVGQAQTGVPGLEPGHAFYFVVDDIKATLERIVAAGGGRHMAETQADAYTFAMAKDPEGNPFGLVRPFGR